MSPRQLYSRNLRLLHSRLRLAEVHETAARRLLESRAADSDQPSPDDALAHLDVNAPHLARIPSGRYQTF